MNYYKRTADALLQDLLDAFGAVLIEGPKWCGKTTTASQHANSILQMQDPSVSFPFFRLKISELSHC